MSEFYSLRRTSIKDTTAFLAFVIAWVGSGPFAWPYIEGGFDGGDPTKGVFRFAFVVFGAGITCGLIGLALGSIGGFAWERVHRHRRATRPLPPRVAAAVSPMPEVARP